MMIKAKLFTALYTGILIATFSGDVAAAELQVRPVLVSVTAPNSSSVLTLKNNGTGAVKAQIRVFRWTQSNGTDRLTPTRDVVASPPFVNMKPGGNYNLRIIRVSKRPLNGEESYRLLVDQIPDVKIKPRGIAVKFNIRYSIPVFFSPAKVSQPKVGWSYSARGGKFTLSARNTGGSRLRISRLNLKSVGGSSRTISKGLAGYVLAGSSKIWRKRGVLKGARKGITVFALGNYGKINTKAKVR